MSKYYLTPEGLEKIKVELEYLQNVKRGEIASRIEKAKEMGDLAENTEYTSAKEEQSFIEGKIAELQHLLRESIVFSKPVNVKFITLGSTVKVKFSDKVKHYCIVGANEVDPIAGKISNESPLGCAFMNKKAGDEIEVNTPGGIVKCKILKIE